MSRLSERENLHSWFEALVEHTNPSLRYCPFCKNQEPEIRLGNYGHHVVTIQCQECGATGPYSDLYTADGYVRKLEDEVAEDRRIVKANFENSVRCWNGSKYKPKTAKAIRVPKGKKIPTYEVFQKDMCDLTQKKAKAYILKHFDLSIANHINVLCTYVKDWINTSLIVSDPDFVSVRIGKEDHFTNSDTYIYMMYIRCFEASEVCDTQTIAIRLAKEVNETDNFMADIFDRVARQFMYMQAIVQNNEQVFNFLLSWKRPL